MKPSPKNLEQFVAVIKEYYQHFGRPFAWRETFDPYHIVVSEIMLQQTQTHRVIDKFDQFIAAFPNFEFLAQASLREVLSVWQGLGYNRRGKALHDIAKIVIAEHNGILPNDPEVLVVFPGIGPATAASITAFAFNIPTSFIETNVRAVFIHFFFKDREDVHDKEIMPLVEATVDHDNPREWYYALMDYGVMLKKKLKNPSRRSKHHTKQSKFEGSDRQIRGAIIRELTKVDKLISDQLISKLSVDPAIKAEPARAQRILDQLIKEGLVAIEQDSVLIVEN